MRTQIDKENAGLNITNFLKWIMQNPDKESNYLKCKLKEIVVERKDIIYRGISTKNVT